SAQSAGPSAGAAASPGSDGEGHFQKSDGLLCRSEAMRFDFIKQYRATKQTGWPVTLMCRMLKVSRPGFYAWSSRRCSASQKRREKLLEQIKAAHEKSRRTYGSWRV